LHKNSISIKIKTKTKMGKSSNPKNGEKNYKSLGSFKDF
jgi:hypothetical protein